MNEIDIAWFAGLFEGEGTFCIAGESVAAGIAIQMTDRDVLERVQGLFGGKITDMPERPGKPHWSKAYKWYCSPSLADSIIPTIQPYLGARRRARSNEYLKLRSAVLGRKSERAAKKEAIIKACASGLTQYEVADMFNVSQPYVNKVLKS